MVQQNVDSVPLRDWSFSRFLSLELATLERLHAALALQRCRRCLPERGRDERYRCNLAEDVFEAALDFGHATLAEVLARSDGPEA